MSVAAQPSDTSIGSFVLRDDPVYEFVKRVMDIGGALAIGGFFLAVLPILAVVIRLDSRGPIFYKQTRIGKDGKHFTIWKLRSMRVDAEQHGAVWATADDERITRVGSVMRKTRVDELPQLWNILCGDMSLVGPRPERPEFTKRLEMAVPGYNNRHLVKPGLTGWAQIKHQYAGTIDESKTKLELDMFYIRHRGPMLDCRILLKTPAIVIARAGR